MATRLRCCRPDEVSRLLPGALAGDYVLAPTSDEAAARALRPELPVDQPDAAVIVTTSGTTGKAKQVVLSAAALRSAAGAFRSRYGAFTWTCALPTQYVAGLMVLVRGQLDADWGGHGVKFARSDLLDIAPDAGRNAISVVPTQLVRALRDPDRSAQLARFDEVLVGGAPLARDVSERARRAGIRVLTSYGMSETCGGCVFERKPLPGVSVQLGAGGRISLAGPMLFSGYRGDPELTAKVLVAGRFLTDDRGEWQTGPTGRRLKVLGRLDDVVISGGINVDLARVQRVVDRLGVGEVAVVAVPDPEWGVRIVLVSEPDALPLDWWRTALRTKIGEAGLPREVVEVTRLPRTTSGKLDRQRIKRLVMNREPR